MKNLILKKTSHAIAESFKRIYNALLVILYSGDEVQCPVCNARYRKFAPAGGARRKNAKCMSCGSRERHRLLWKYLTEKTSLFKAQSKLYMLHFAPEQFFHRAFSDNPFIDYIPCDLFPEHYSSWKGAKVRKADITCIPFKDNTFDVIICNHVLEHIESDNLAMSELHRVLKPNGWAILQVPLDYKREFTYEDFTITAPSERKRAFGHEEHVRVYGRDYRSKLENAGFRVSEDAYVKSLSSQELKRFALMPDELIYFCSK